MCGKSAVQPILGSNVLGVGGKAYAVQHFSFMSIWRSKTEENHVLMFFMQCRGLGRNEKKFATSEETAYPMGLAKMFATCIVLALINLGIKAPEETMHQLKATSWRSKQQMKAATGLQPKASRIPPLVPTCKARIKIQAMSELLPDFQLYQKCKQNLKLDAPNDPVLPKGAKLLSIQPAKTLSVGGARISLCRRFY